MKAVKELAIVTALFVALICWSKAYGGEYNFTTINDPDAIHTLLLGFNDLGDAVGYSGTSTAQPFLYSDGQFYDVAVPGAVGLTLFSINRAGLIAGTLAIPGQGQQGVLMDETTTTLLQATRADSVNNHNAAVGYMSTPAFNMLAYKYKDGKYIQLEMPAGILGSAATGINDRGDIVGYYFYDNATGQQVTQGFVRKDGVLYPLAITPVGINSDGVIVGLSGAGNDAAVLENGVVTIIKVPGADYTAIRGINNKGHVVGYYMQAGVYHGFIGKPIPLAKVVKR